MSSLPRPSEEEFLEKALRDCEDELVSSLSGVDTQELYKEFLKRFLLSDESCTSFTSLDSSLDSQLQVRYLMRLASEKVKTDSALGHNLIRVLEKEGVPSSLTGKLEQADINDGPTDDSGTEGSLSAIAVVEAGDVALTQEDVKSLTDLLVNVSYKWKEIAISLGLGLNQRTDCEEKSNTISLAQCIELWISINSDATLKVLTNALSSNTVGEKMLSEKVRKEVLTAKQPKCSQKEKNLSCWV